MKKERYLINEAAKEVHVEAHVLRYWEEELSLPIGRNEQGHRIYTQADIDRFIEIKDLKDQGLQLKAVKTLLGMGQEHDEGGDDMRADNPFAQKQLTKISRLGEAKMIALKNSEDARWNERFGSRRHEGPKMPAEELADDNNIIKNMEGRGMTEEKAEEKNMAEKNMTEKNMTEKNMIEIKEMRSLDRTGNYQEESRLQEVQDEQKKEQTMRLQYLFQKLIKEAVAANNEELADNLAARITENVKGDLCKELDYQFRLMEEREEERAVSRREQEDIRSEDYYRRIDELLRQYNGKSIKRKTKEKNKEKAKEKTIAFPLSKEKNQEKEGVKAKKEFRLFHKPSQPKTVEAK